MGNNAHWSPEDLRKKGLVQDGSGNYVPVKSLVAKGSVDKIQLPPDFLNHSKIGIIDSLGRKVPILTATIPQSQYWQLPSGEQLIIKTMFHMDPLPAPRMVQSDKWKTDPHHADPLKRQRPPVTRYFAFKNKLTRLCTENGYNLTEVLNILFVVPMPPSWSKKKRSAMRFKEHQQRPDRDNYLKAFQDAFACDDGFVWDGRTIKVWGNIGEIIIF